MEVPSDPATEPRRAAEAAAAVEAEAAAASQAAEEKKQARFKAVQSHETDLLNARSQPLRRYLMANVMPSLTQGLLDVVQQQPDDPVDHLVSSRPVRELLCFALLCAAALVLTCPCAYPSPQAEFLFRKNLEAESAASDFKAEFTVSSEAKDGEDSLKADAKE